MTYTYEYEPLQAGTKELRLLKLFPGSYTDDIEVEIYHIPLLPFNDQSSRHTDKLYPHEYEALSYVWGRTHRTEKVVVRNGKKVQKRPTYESSSTPIDDDTPYPSGHTEKQEVSQSQTREGLETKEERLITLSLATALRHLRYPLEPRILWADGLCIDQENIAERSREVGRMSLIFSSASRIIFWLGTSADNSSLAIETISLIGQDVLFEDEKHLITVKPGSRLAKLAADLKAMREMQESWIAIRELVRRTFFQRLWIYQEIQLATKAILLIGKCAPIDWNVFLAGFQWIFYQTVDPTCVISEQLDYKELSAVNNMLFRQRTPKWRDLFTRTSHMDCFDPRDRIYAMLSLLPVSGSTGIVPDYSKDHKEVYKGFMIRSIVTQDVLDLFALCMLSEGDDDSGSISWVPDLNVRRVAMLFNYGQATGKSKHETSHEEEHSRLRVRGLLLGTRGMVVCGDASVPRNAKLSVITDLCRQWAPLDLFEADYVGGGTLLDAFTVVLAAGEVQELRPPGWGLRPSIPEGRRAVSDMLGKNHPISSPLGEGSSGEKEQVQVSTYSRYLERWLPGRKIFTTQDGYLGVGPASVRSGDCIAFAIGCPEPLLLRPDYSRPEAAGGDHFRLVGTCYVHGYMNSEALLGRLPEGWTHDFAIVGETPINTYTHVGPEKSSRTQQLDPRLSALPEGWRFWYGGVEGGTKYEEEFSGEGEMRILWFEEMGSGEVMRYDPRLSSAVLKERGVKIQDFYLI